LRLQPPRGRGNLDPVIDAFNDHAPVEFTEPFEVQAVGHVFGRLLAPLDHRISLLEWQIEHPHFARSRQVAGAPALERMEMRVFAQRDGRAGIIELQNAAGEIRTRIAFELEQDRLGNTVEPNAPVDHALLAVINFAADHVVVNAPGHARSLPRMEKNQHEFTPAERALANEHGLLESVLVGVSLDWNSRRKTPGDKIAR